MKKMNAFEYTPIWYQSLEKSLSHCSSQCTTIGLVLFRIFFCTSSRPFIFGVLPIPCSFAYTIRVYLTASLLSSSINLINSCHYVIKHDNFATLSVRCVLAQILFVHKVLCREHVFICVCVCIFLLLSLLFNIIKWELWIKCEKWLQLVCACKTRKKREIFFFSNWQSNFSMNYYYVYYANDFMLVEAIILVYMFASLSFCV